LKLGPAGCGGEQTAARQEILADRIRRELDRQVSARREPTASLARNPCRPACSSPAVTEPRAADHPRPWEVVFIPLGIFVVYSIISPARRQQKTAL